MDLLKQKTRGFELTGTLLGNATFNFAVSIVGFERSPYVDKKLVWEIRKTIWVCNLQDLVDPTNNQIHEQSVTFNLVESSGPYTGVGDPEPVVAQLNYSPYARARVRLIDAVGYNTAFHQTSVANDDSISLGRFKPVWTRDFPPGLFVIPPRLFVGVGIKNWLNAAAQGEISGYVVIHYYERWIPTADYIALLGIEPIEFPHHIVL